MKRAVVLTACLLAGGLALWMGLYPADWQNWLGFSRAAYFKTGQNYAFASGIGPMLLTTIGMSTIIVGLWHSINCHEDGCYMIGRHKVNGTPWCNRHHEDARHEKTVEQLLTEQNELLRQVLERTAR